jgi:TPR repeat protein
MNNRLQMNKAIIILFLLLSCQDSKRVSQEVASADSSGQIDTFLSEMARDSIYNYAYETLNGDMAEPDYESARESLTSCANAHDDRCETLLGYHLVKGVRFKKDVESGVKFLERAIAANNMDAVLYLSDYYYETGLADSSIAILEKAHKRGFSYATYVLSGIYLKGTNIGLGRPELKYNSILNFEKGIRYLKNAAENETEAKFYLAHYYLRGVNDHLERDTAKALNILREMLAGENIDSIPGLRDRVEMTLDEILKM